MSLMAKYNLFYLEVENYNKKPDRSDIRKR